MKGKLGRNEGMEIKCLTVGRWIVIFSVALIV
jgi:hypothetical protein